MDTLITRPETRATENAVVVVGLLQGLQPRTPNDSNDAIQQILILSLYLPPVVQLCSLENIFLHSLTLRSCFWDMYDRLALHAQVNRLRRQFSLRFADHS